MQAVFEKNEENNKYGLMVNVKYSYIVNQKNFTGSRLSFGDNSRGSYVKQKQICNILSDGVNVHYQPDNPSNAVIILEKNNKYPHLDWIIVSICLALLTALVIITGAIWHLVKFCLSDTLQKNIHIFHVYIL